MVGVKSVISVVVGFDARCALTTCTCSGQVLAVHTDQSSTLRLVLFLILLLFYAIATVFQLYLSGDMMYEIRRKSKM